MCCWLCKRSSLPWSINSGPLPSSEFVTPYFIHPPLSVNLGPISLVLFGTFVVIIHSDRCSLRRSPFSNSPSRSTTKILRCTVLLKFYCLEIMESVDCFKSGAILLLAIISCTAYLIIFRLFFNRCRHIPGPLLARISYAYHFYYDIVLGGCTSENILRLHETFGCLHCSFRGEQANHSLQAQSFALHQIGFMSRTPNST